MTARDFAFWLQGCFEISESTSLNEKQTQIVKNHLKLVFIHDIDPKIEQTTPASVLNSIHNNEPKARC